MSNPISIAPPAGCLNWIDSPVGTTIDGACKIYA